MIWQTQPAETPAAALVAHIHDALAAAGAGAASPDLAGRHAAAAEAVAEFFRESAPGTAVATEYLIMTAARALWAAGAEAVAVNGQLDTSVPPAGGPPGGMGARAGAWDGTPTQPTLAQGSFWAAANGCQTPPSVAEQPPIIRWRYRCAPGRAVEVVLVGDNGHAWPGGQAGRARADAPNAAWSATDVIWSFFEAHTK